MKTLSETVSSRQARPHHGAVELSHLGGKHPGLPDRRLLGLHQLGPVLHRAGDHHRGHGRRLLPVPHRA